MISTVEKQYIDGNFTRTYKVTYSSGEILWVAHNEEKRHYQEILEWVALGNTITDNGGGE